MALSIKLEEYSALGDFIKASFINGQAQFTARFPKLDAAFLTEFEAKLQEIKTLESTLVITTEQKAATTQLYAEAALLNKELNFLSLYMKEANLSTTAVSALKKDLTSGNIEGALLKLESVKQYVTAHQTELEAEGMANNFTTTLAQYKSKLMQNNALQNNYMNNRKQITEQNSAKYKELYGYIAKIAKAGKLIFDGTTKKDEYVVNKLVNRMRVMTKNSNGTTNSSV
jgi:hypothetical protein